MGEEIGVVGISYRKSEYSILRSDVVSNGESVTSAHKRYREMGAPVNKRSPTTGKHPEMILLGFQRHLKA